MRFFRWFHYLLAALVGAVLLAGCGGGGRIVVSVPTATAPGLTSVKAPAPAIRQPGAGCAPGHSFMGCNAAITRSLTAGLMPTGQGYFPDVSSFQPGVRWELAKPHIRAAVFKLGEYHADPQAARNASEVKRLGIQWAVYWFVRPTGCSHEGALLSALAQQLGVHLLVLDEEVPGIQGYAACLAPFVQRATGHGAVVYRSAGNDFDTTAASLPCWVAAYGPSHTPSCFGRAPVAFQFTDGRFGFPVFIPGIGQGDVSVNLGMFSAADPRQLDHLDGRRRAFHVHGRVVRAQERNTVRVALAHRCVTGSRSRACRSSVAHLKLLRGRLLALHAHGASWGSGSPAPIGVRNQVLYHEIHATRVYVTWTQMVRGR